MDEIRKGYVENFITTENDSIWDAYLAIDVNAKNGNEEIPYLLRECLENTTQYLGLCDFFETNKEKEIWITDDVISLDNKLDAWSVLHGILGKEIVVHLCVNPDKVLDVNEYLRQAAEEETEYALLLTMWKHVDDGYLIQIVKRITYNVEYTIRLYEDGNGVVVYRGVKENKIKYFKIKVNLCNKINGIVDKKVDYILANPRSCFEDDRYWGFSVLLKYGLMRKCPDAEEILKEGMVYEEYEYANDEQKIKLAKLLLSAPEVKEALDEAMQILI